MAFSCCGVYVRGDACMSMAISRKSVLHTTDKVLKRERAFFESDLSLPGDFSLLHGNSVLGIDSSFLAKSID